MRHEETPARAEVVAVSAPPPAPEGIELRHLRAFTAVAEELNFSRAAARLYLSAPALSRQVSGLERLVGCELLRRSTHRVELTVAGEALLKSTRALLADLDAALYQARSVGGELADRAARLWWEARGAVGHDPVLQELREGCEATLGQFAVPEEVTTRAVNAGGVPGFVLATSPRPRAEVLYLHGGAYVMGSAFAYRPLCGALAVASDTAVLVPEYRLAPEHPYPAAVEDAVRAYRWMVEQGTKPHRVVVAGESSGAHLALSLLLSLEQERLAVPGGAVLLSPVVDLAASPWKGIEQPESRGLLADHHVRRFVSDYLAGHPIDDPLIAPLRAELGGLPPMLVQSSTGDPLLDGARQLTEHARTHGVDVRLELYPATAHAFQIFWSFLPEAADAVRSAGAFVRARSSPTATA